ncbi:hypothetical protein BDR06DRAFT_900556, partial [Suillus hirtellus]
YPSAFVHSRKDKKVVRAAMDTQYPEGFSASDLPLYDPPGSFWLLPPKKAEETKRSLHPPFLAARFSSVITLRGQKALIKAWDGLHHPSLNVRHYTSSRESNRSSTPAYHFGIWQVQQPRPVVTQETRKQGPAELKAIDKFLSAVKRHVAPKITALLQHYAPKQHERQQRCVILQSNYTMLIPAITFRAYRFITTRNTVVKDAILKRPALDFSGAFFTLAVKEGTSEIIHIDWNDDLDSITWLIALGDWEGGYIVLPQNGIMVRIPVRAGDLFGFMARTLAHCTTPVTKGRRIILTCFSDSNILRNGRFKLYFRSVRIL